MNQTADCMRLLGTVRHKQGHLGPAEEILADGERLFTDIDDRLGLANCALEFGYLRIDQGRPELAIAHFKSAYRLYREFEMYLYLYLYAEECRESIEKLEVTVVPADDDSK